MMVVSRLMVCCALLLAAGPGLADVLYVDDNAPSDPAPGDTSAGDDAEDGSPDHPFDAIGQAIDAATDGDVIVVLDGTYTGEGNRDMDFAGKAITVRSQNGPDDCVINIEGTDEEHHRAFYFHSGETTASVVEGFTITGGTHERGGAIMCNYAGPTISGNLFLANSASIDGGAILAQVSGIAVVGNTFIGNSALNGGGACFSYGAPVVTNNVFSNNTADFGGGIDCFGTAARLSHNTISGNTAAMGGGLGCNSSSYVDMINSIVWGNTADAGADIAVINVSGLKVSYCNVAGGEAAVYIERSFIVWNGGNIDADPMFAGATSHDFRPRPGSPCIDAAGESLVATDIIGTPRPFDWPGVDANGELPDADIGAIEAVWVAVTLEGDVTGDDCVNVADLLMVRDKLGKSGSESGTADVNSDGVVNIADLLIVRDSLGHGAGCGGDVDR